MTDSTLQIILFVANLVIAGAVSAFTASHKIGQYKEKVDNLEKEKEKLCTKHDVIRSDMDKMLEFKASTQKYIDSKIYQSNSPLSLTDFGKTMVRESGFATIFEKTKPDLAAKLAAKNPKTKYDVQEMARSLLDELTDYPDFQPIKKYAFEKGIDFTQILRAGSIHLRDYYFELHPEITDSTGY